MRTPNEESPLSPLGLIIWGLAALFFLYEFFLRTFVGSVAHQVIPDLKLNAETFSIIGSAYYVAYGIMQVPVGVLVDKFGVKILMVFATLVCVVSTLLFAHATDFITALISRTLMGLGSSFAFVCLLVIAVIWLPKKYFGFFAGTSQFIGTMGPLLAGGPLIALMTKTHQDWRATLSEIGVFGIVLTFLIIILVKNKPRHKKKTLIFLKHQEPLKCRLKRLAKNQQAWAVAFYSGTVYVSMALLGAIWGTEYLQVRGLSQGVAASIISLAWLGYAVGCPLLGALSDMAKRRKPTLIFCSLLGLFTTAGIVYIPLHDAHWAYASLFVCLGFAASGQNVGFATIAEHSDASTKATALGLNNAVITLFSALIPPLTSYFIYLSTGVGNNHLTPESFTLAFTIMPILYIGALVISILCIKETYCKPQKEPILLQTTLVTKPPES